MRQRQQLFLSINRIFLLLYAPLCIAWSIFFFFTGSLLYSVLSLVTIFWLFFPQLIHKVLHIRTAHVLVFFYLLFVLLGYSFGLVLRVQRFIPFYGELIHLLGGFFFSVTAAALFCCYTNQRPAKKHLFFANVFCFSCATVCGVIWELLQTAVCSFLLHTDIAVRDLALDLIACMIGAGILCILTFLYARKDIHTYPLYAFEDFAALNIKINISYAPTSTHNEK